MKLLYLNLCALIALCISPSSAFSPLLVTRVMKAKGVSKAGGAAKKVAAKKGPVKKTVAFSNPLAKAKPVRTGAGTRVVAPKKKTVAKKTVVKKTVAKAKAAAPKPSFSLPKLGGGGGAAKGATGTKVVKATKGAKGKKVVKAAKGDKATKGAKTSASKSLSIPKISLPKAPTVALPGLKVEMVKGGPGQKAPSMKSFGAKKTVVAASKPQPTKKKPATAAAKGKGKPLPSLPSAPSLPSVPSTPSLPNFSAIVSDFGVGGPLGIAGQGMALLSPAFLFEAKAQAFGTGLVGEIIGAPFRCDPQTVRNDIKYELGKNPAGVVYTYGLSPFSSEARKILENYNVKEVSMGAEWVSCASLRFAQSAKARGRR